MTDLVDKAKTINKTFSDHEKFKQEQQTRINEFKKKYRDIIKSESDIYIFKYKWYDCCIYRVMGHLNGYVAPKTKNINKDSLSVHGWITLNWKLSLSVEWYDFSYCLWFDTAHYMDAFYDEQAWYAFMFGEGTYKDYKYVLAEVKSLVEQIKSIEDSILSKKTNPNDKD